MKKIKNNNNYYDFIKKNNNLPPNSNNTIQTDSYLLIKLLKNLFIYTLFLIPNICLLFFSLFSQDKNKKIIYFKKIFFIPFDILKSIIEWFFQAKITAWLIIILFFIFYIQIMYLEPFMNSLMTHQLHLFQGNYYSIFTSIFLHANIIHLLSNCIALLIFGRIVEKEIKFNTIFLFISSGVIANLISNYISYIQSDIYYSLGASGAIAGLIIFAILLNPFSFTSIFVIPIPIFIIGWLLIGIDLIGLTAPSNTNHLAHIGGYLTLLILFFFLELKHKKKILNGFIINLILLSLLFILNQIYNLRPLFF
ncbi:MAG: rhomboid family intramembrane serine protease [Nanoarchaeota archaeon]